MRRLSFEGRVGEFFVEYLVFTLLASITLGLYIPWGICKMYKWQIESTRIGDSRMKFDGNGKDLFLPFLMWSFLTIISFGIYFFWMQVNLQKWLAEHTVLVD